MKVYDEGIIFGGTASKFKRLNKGTDIFHSEF